MLMANNLSRQESLVNLKTMKTNLKMQPPPKKIIYREKFYLFLIFIKLLPDA